MEQCFAGGFNAPILAHSTANATSVASAATEFESSWASPDLHWDSFARDWVAAQAGHNPDGSALASNPDVDSNGVIEAEEAYGYALAVQNPSDSPNFSESSEAGGDITLGQHYVFWWWWCWIILPLLEEHYRRLPEPEFYERLEEVIPELQKVAPQIEQSAVDLRREVRPGFESMIEAAFRRAAE
jgi:hypothetical protein